MPQLCANLSFLWNELDFLDRFAAAGRAGFSGVEYLFPYEHDKNRIADELKRHGLTQVLFNLPAGDWARGERGIGCHPGRTREFEEGVARAIDYARALDCPQVNCLAGLRPRHVDWQRVLEAYAHAAASEPETRREAATAKAGRRSAAAPGSA